MKPLTHIFFYNNKLAYIKTFPMDLIKQEIQSAIKGDIWDELLSIEDDIWDVVWMQIASPLREHLRLRINA